MAARHHTLSELITIKQGVTILADTPYPVTYKQLARWLSASGAAAERHGRTDYYSASDIMEAHRDGIDRMLAAVSS